MYNRQNLSDQELIEILPNTMGTQHPDNVSAVPFGDSPRVSRTLEEEEVLYNISTLGVRELMIDYERKQGDCTPLWSWVQRCQSCLQQKVLGRDFHVTPRIPNGDKERDDPYFWQSMGIFTHSPLVMERMGFEQQPFTEFIIPDASSGETAAKIEQDILDLYKLHKSQYEHYEPRATYPYQGDFFVQGIPLIETVEDLLEPERIWDELIRRRREWTGRETYVQRSFIARSDPALKAGLVPALIAARVALDRGRRYEAETGVRIPQIVGIGSAPFRGGLSPDKESLDQVLATYPGMATVTIQSAFRYDYPLDKVVKANQKLEEKVAASWLARHRIKPVADEGEMEALMDVVKTFKESYEESYRAILPLVSRVAQSVPSHRERYQNVEVTGDDRRVGGRPAVRAIKFAASCYSLGIPPGLLGFRAWFELEKETRKLVERICPTLLHWMREELRWLNNDNLDEFEDMGEQVEVVFDDVDAVREWVPFRTVDSRHAEVTSQIPQRLEREESMTDLIMEAAGMRSFLG